MSPDRAIHCPEFARRFDGFLDGEVEPEVLRAMSVHAAECASCGAEVTRAERLQSLLSEAVDERVKSLDTSELWASIQAGLEAPRSSFWDRAREAMLGALSMDRWLRPAPALVLSGAAAAALAFWLWPSAIEPTRAPVEIANNHAHIERIASSAPHVAVWSEPERHTTAIWVASYDPEGMP